MSPLSLGKKNPHKSPILGQVFTFLVVGKLVFPQFPLLSKTLHTWSLPTSKHEEGGVWVKASSPSPASCVYLVLSNCM